MILSTSRSRCHQAKSSIFSGSWSKTQNSDQNRVYPSLTLLTAKLFPLKRVLNLKRVLKNDYRLDSDLACWACRWISSRVKRANHELSLNCLSIQYKCCSIRHTHRVYCKCLSRSWNCLNTAIAIRHAACASVEVGTVSLA